MAAEPSQCSSEVPGDRDQGGQEEGAGGDLEGAAGGEGVLGDRLELVGGLDAGRAGGQVLQVQGGGGVGGEVVERDPPVPVAYATLSVSPCIIVTLSGSIPSRSQRIWVNMVS